MKTAFDRMQELARAGDNMSMAESQPGGEMSQVIQVCRQFNPDFKMCVKAGTFYGSTEDGLINDAEGKRKHAYDKHMKTG